MSEKIVYGKEIIVNSDKVIKNGAVFIKDGRVAETGPYGEIVDKHTGVPKVGSSDHIVMPGFINAHNHGKGVTDFQRGQLDDTLETWKFRNYPPIDPVLDTKWAAVKQLEAGITTTMHNHDFNNPQEYEREFNGIIGGYKECGLKVAFAPSMNNRNWFVYGDNRQFIDSLPSELRDLCNARIKQSALFGLPEYLDSVERLLAAYRDDKQVKIMYGPISPQWIDEDSLRAVKQDASRKNLRVHIHVQQTKLQNLYGYKQYGTSLIGFLDSLGFLDENVTIGHAVWVSQQDIEIMAARKVSATHHPTCNFRVRNGVSPVYYMLEAGIPMAVGLDDKEFGDDKDFLEEMRLISKLHRLPDHRLDSPHIQPNQVFQMGTVNGAKTLGWENEVGTLEVGAVADMVLLDARRISEPFVSPSQSVIDLLLYRAGTRDIDMVLTAGEVVVKGGKVVHVDREEIARAIRENLPEDYIAEFEKRNSLLRKLRPYIAEWFSGWYDEMQSFEGAPFYHLNNK